MTITSALALILLALALGAFSSIVFVWQWIAGAPTQLSATILAVAVAAVFLRLFLYLKRRIPQLPIHSDRHWIFRGLPPACAVLGIGYAGVSIVQHVKMLPHGTWDAWAVWNVHARFLHRGSAGLWRDIFVPAMSGSQNDYPLLLPGLVSGAWTVTGAESPWVPAVLAIVFASLSIGIVSSAVSALARDERGLLAGLLLLATPSFLLTAACQTADIPIALFMLTTVVLLQFADAWPDVKRPMLVLAGLSAGFAAWTKNEGLLFVVAVFGSHLASFALLRSWRALRDNVVMISLGLAPMLVLVFGFKAFLAPSSNIVSVNVLNQTFGQMAAIDRYQQIVWGFLEEAAGFGGTWRVGGMHPAVLLAAFLLLYASPLKMVRPTSLSLLLLIVFILGGYFMVYVFSPYGRVNGYLGGTLDRLYLQLWPACLFILATVQLPMNSADNLPVRRSDE